MQCSCLTYQCLEVDYSPCSQGIELPIMANESGNWTVLIEFNGAWIRRNVVVTDGQPVVIQNILNEYYVHIIRLLNTDKELVNDTCYKLVTKSFSAASITPVIPNDYKETFRLDFEVTDDTSQPFALLIGAELLEVNIEEQDIETAILDNATGFVTWGTGVGVGQTGFILYKK